jgi:hypothetical protein
MFGIFRKRWHRLDEQAPVDESDSPLHFGTEDRESARATSSSDEIVKHLFEQARDKAENLTSGEEVDVELSTNHPNVHHMEIMTSLFNPKWTNEYGMRFSVQFDNTFSFTKV